MVRRRCAGIGAWLILAPTVLAALSACGSSNGQLQVALSSDATATYAPGEQATVTVSVTNTGPGSVSGVTVHVALPQGFRYRSTAPFTAAGSTRTQPLDADVNTQSPIWGVWDLGAPGTAAPGKTSSVAIQFSVEVQGQPGKDPITAYAVGDVATGQVGASPIALTVAPAAVLGALVSVNPATAKAGGSVLYEVHVTNTGTDEALIGVLVTLPPSLTFTNSVMPFTGNASRNGGINPIKSSLEVYYDGFTLPTNSSAGPGYVIIRFKATVVAGAQAGTFPVDCNITDSKGDTLSLHAVAPLTILPGGSPSANPATASSPA